jgi:uncharacterized protein (TIGR03067 family)
MIDRLVRYLTVLVFLLASVSLTVAQDDKKGTPELQGIWKLSAAEGNGEELEFPKNLPRWVIKGDTVHYGREPLLRLKADAKANPKTLDLHFVESKHDYEAIYKIEGDTLRICVNPRTDGPKERPGDFTTKESADRRLFVFQRQKPDAGDGTDEAPGFAGVQIAKDPDEKGVLVVGAIGKSPAEKAGLKKDDLIVKVSGEPVTELKDAVDRVRQVRPGKDLVLRIRRGDEEKDVKVRVRVIPFYLLDL